MICSFFAGIAGGLYAPYIKVIAPGNFTVWGSVELLLALVVGGIAYFWGPTIGAVLLTVMPEALRVVATYEPIVSSSILLLIVFFLPGGLASLPRVVRARMRR